MVGVAAPAWTQSRYSVPVEAETAGMEAEAVERIIAEVEARVEADAMLLATQPTQEVCVKPAVLVVGKHYKFMPMDILYFKGATLQAIDAGCWAKVLAKSNTNSLSTVYINLRTLNAVQQLTALLP